MTEKMKVIPEQKLKAFSIGTMGKRTLSKKEMEEQRKKDEQKAAAHAFQEFVETFEDVPINGNKVWIKAGTYDAGARKEDTKEKGKLYKPQSRVSQSNILPHQELLSSAEKAHAYARMLTGDKKPDRLGKRKPSGKSNLESFKEELRQIQEEREERHKYKGSVRVNPIESELDLLLKHDDLGSFDNGDPTTTNLYLGNLNPKITEQQLMQVFGRYGPLASIKIMWPRSDEEKARGRNCGFVAYMSRKDGERALRNLNGRDVLGYEMKLGWGKSVIIPPHPIYIPPALLDLSMPPPPSGLPFNAQPLPKDKDVLPTTAEELNEILSRSIIKVVIPTDRNLLMLIHRMVEFVVREGPLFEAMIMNREITNPMFRFLFENQSPAHTYYRWKLFSILHGDSQKEWTTKEFRMFMGGSTWKPPLMASYTSGMPDELILEDEAREASKGSLSNTQRDRLEDLIRNLTPERKKIGEVMVFCIEHSDASDEVADCILESLSNESTSITRKIARLYLISDILHNCSVKVNKASFYRRAFENRLLVIMRQLRSTHDRLLGRLKAEGFKVRVLRTLKAWEDAIYPRDFMVKLHNAFLGLEIDKKKHIEVPIVDDNLDGNPVTEMETDEDLPMDGAVLLKSAMKNLKSPSPFDDIDGVEINEGEEEDDDDKIESETLSGFIVSKWETIDPEEVVAQAMTTSKWDLLEGGSEENSQASKNENQDSSDYNDMRDISEEKRSKLREIEVKAVQYQDELESGQRSLKSGWTVPQQVEHYRRKLLKKSDKERKSKDISSSKSEKHKRESSEEEYYKEVTSRKNKKHARSTPKRSSSKHRSKSRSPVRKRGRAISPSSPRRRHSPPPTKSRYRSPTSPDNSSHSSSRHGRHSQTPPRRHRRSPSVSPPVRSRHRNTSPTVRRKRKHKHRH